MQIYSKEINNFYIFHVLCLDLKCLNREIEEEKEEKQHMTVLSNFEKKL